MAAFSGGACTDGSTNCEWDSANQKAYLDLRAFIKDPATLQAQIDVVRNVTDPDNLYVISLGDEIAVTAPDPTATSSANFTKYCEEQNVSVADGCGGGNATVSIAEAAGDKLSNGRYYHSQKFIHHRAIQVRFKALLGHVGRIDWWFSQAWFHHRGMGFARRSTSRI